MFKAAWHYCNAPLLNWCVDVAVLCQEGAQLVRNKTEEDFFTHQGDNAELVYLAGVLFLRNPHPFSHTPLFGDPNPSPDDLQDLPQMQWEFGTVLVHFVLRATQSWSIACPCFMDNLPEFLQLAFWQFKRHCWFRWFIKMLHSSNSCSLSGLLYVCLRWWSISSCKQASFLFRFCPSSSLVNLKGLAIKVARLWALTWRRLLCHSAQWTLILLRTMHINWDKPMRSSSPACLYWGFSVFVSCLMVCILSTLW